jgi:rubrerythrin
VWVDDENEGKHPGAAAVRPGSKGGFDVTADRVAHGDCTPTKTKPDGTNEGPERTVTTWRVVLHVDAGGKLTEASSAKPTKEQAYCGGLGRRPEGFVADADDDPTVEGYLRRALHVEAESVRAFERIARELAAHGAPAELVAGALHAAAQERDHARRCAALLGVDADIATDALPARTLLALALDNAREGCALESYGALANAVQARTAATAALRAHFAAIAADELEHAALAHAIASWLDTQLSADDRALVRAARGEALDGVAAAVERAPGAIGLGLPDATTARRLLAVVRAHNWS